MFKTGILKTVYFLAITLVGLLLLYIYFVIHPSYHDLLVENSEDEAVRYVSFLAHAYKLDLGPMVPEMFPEEVTQEINQFDSDSELIKLRAFDASGKIIFSTMPKEIGQINEHDYFHQTVAHGEVYSKVVQKDNFTAELEVVKNDLVETYVPIMGAGGFYGAIETYYDVTKSSEAIRSLTSHSLLFLGGASFFLLCLFYYALRHADRSFVARIRAEESLRRANEDLEERVAERAGELIRVNQELSDEVSERTLAQMALSEALSEMVAAKEKIDGILRSVTDGLLVVDQNRQVVLMNGPAEEIIGTSLADAAGKPINELEMPESLRLALSGLLSDPDSSIADFSLARPTHAGPRTFQARTSVMRDLEKSVRGTIVLMQDVTTAREIDQMKSRFLAMAAHELMTPLASIMGYSELLGSEVVNQLTDEQKKEFLQYIHLKAESLSRIVDDLLDLSRIESGQDIPIAKIDFDLCVILHRLVKVYQETNHAQQIEFDTECRNCQLFADPVRIEQVIENLLSNAVKYSSAGGLVQIRCDSDQQSCRFEIIDHGVGMSAEQVARVFDQFYRVDTSDTAKRGVGLGLSIVKHIIDAHHGTIEVKSELGQGTRVMFSLPRRGKGANEDGKLG